MTEVQLVTESAQREKRISKLSSSAHSEPLLENVKRRYDKDISILSEQDESKNRQIAIEPSLITALTSSEQLQRPFRTSSLHSIDSLGPLHSSMSKGAKHIMRCSGNRGDESGHHLFIPAPLSSFLDSKSKKSVTSSRIPLEALHHQHLHLRYPTFYFRKLPKAYRSPTQRNHPEIGSPLNRERHFSVQQIPSSSSINSFQSLNLTHSPLSLDVDTSFASSALSETYLYEEMPSDYSSFMAKYGNDSLQLQQMTADRIPAINGQSTSPLTHILPSNHTSAKIPMFPTVSLEQYRRQLAGQRSIIKVETQKDPQSSHTCRGHRRSRTTSDINRHQYRPGSWTWYEPPKSRDKPLPRPAEYYSRPSTRPSSGSNQRHATDKKHFDDLDMPKSGWDDDDDEEEEEEEEETTAKGNGIIRWNSLKFKSLKRKELPKYPNSSTNTYNSYSDPISTSSSRNVETSQSRTGQAIGIARKGEASSSSSSVRFASSHSRQLSSQSSLQSSLIPRKLPIRLNATQVMLSPRPIKNRPALIRTEATQQYNLNFASKSGFNPSGNKRIPLSDEYFQTVGWTKSARHSKGLDWKNSTKRSSVQTPHRITLDTNPTKTSIKAPPACPLLDVLRKPDEFEHHEAHLEGNVGLASPIQLLDKALPRTPSIVTNQIDTLIGNLQDDNHTSQAKVTIGDGLHKRYTPISSGAVTTPRTIGTDPSLEGPSPPDPPTPSSTRCSPLSSFFEGYGDQSMPTAEREQWYQDARIGKSTFGGVEMSNDLTEFPLWQNAKDDVKDIIVDQKRMTNVANRFPSAQRVRSPYEGLFDAYVNSDVSRAASRTSIKPEIGNIDTLSSQTDVRKEPKGSTSTSVESVPEVEKIVSQSPSLHIASQGLNIAIEDKEPIMKVSVMYRAALTYPGGKNDMNFCGAIALSEDDMKRICESWLSLKHRTQSMTSIYSSEDANIEEIEKEVDQESQEVVSFPGDDYEEERIAMEKRQEDLKRQVSTKMKLLRNRSVKRTQIASINTIPPQMMMMNANVATASSSSASSSSTPHIKPLLLTLSLPSKASRSAEELYRKTSTKENQALQRLQRRPHSSSNESIMSIKGVSIAYRSSNFSIDRYAPQAM